MKDPMELSKREVTLFTVEFFLLHAARCPTVFHTARGHLKPEHLSEPGETAHRTIWALILSHYEEHQALPSMLALSTRAMNVLSTNVNPNVPREQREAPYMAANDIIRWIFDTDINPDSALEPNEAINMLRELLLDRDPGASLRRAVLDSGDRRIHNLPELLERARQRVETITALGQADTEENTMPTTWVTAGRPKWPTGVDFIDKIMEGGSEPGDCNIIIGPTGGGKTTLSMQIACQIARQQLLYEAKPDLGIEPGLVVFISYEDGKRMLQIRAASCGAKVHKNELRFLKSEDALSTAGNLKTYEQEMYRLMGQKTDLMGEKERLEQARPWLNKYLHLVDFNDPKNGGRGHVPEIRQKLVAIQEKRGMPIRAVFLDWAGEMIRNYLLQEKGSLDGGQMSLELAGLVHRCKGELAVPFNTTVWIPHQLGGRFCKLPAGRVPHHSEAQWCTSFADNAWFAFCISTKDEEHSVCQIAATKTRHGESVPPVICKIDGAFCQMVDVSSQFSTDKLTNRLMPKKLLEQAHGKLSGETHAVNIATGKRERGRGPLGNAMEDMI